MFVDESPVDDRLRWRKTLVWSDGERLSVERRGKSNIRGDLAYIRGISIQLPDIRPGISVTRCKFPSLNLKIRTGESRRTVNEYFMSVSVWCHVLPNDFHSSSLREISVKGSVDENLHINPAIDYPANSRNPTHNHNYNSLTLPPPLPQFYPNALSILCSGNLPVDELI